MEETKKEPVGLVMEGGAMRGLFTAGVLDVFMENAVSFDAAIGVSAGAAFGCNYKSKQIGRAIRYNKRYCRDPRYVSVRSWLFTGNLYNAKFAYGRMVRELDVFDTKTFRENPLPFYVVCTDVKTGKPVYHLCRDGGEEDIRWIRASASMPVVSRPVKIDGLKLLDGGIADSVPLSWFRGIGYQKNVVILTQPLGYQKKPNRYMPLARIALFRYPGMISAMANRHLRYREMLADIAHREEAGDTLVIRPPQPLQVGGVERDPARLEAVYQIGRETAKVSLDAVFAFLSPANPLQS